MAGIGTPLSSIPNTSWANVSEPISSAGFSGAPLGGKSFSMDPFSIGLGIANLGASIFGGINSANAQRDAAAQQVAAAEFAAQQQLNARNAQLAQNLLGMQFGELIAAPRELERQKEAFRFQYGPGADLRRASESEDWRRQMARASSGEAKDIARFQSLLNARAQSFANRAQQRGMFGPNLEDAMFMGA